MLYYICVGELRTLKDTHMSKGSLKDMVLSLGDLSITNEEMNQAIEIMTAVNDAMVESNQKVGFEHVVLWWIGCEPAEA